MAKRGEGAENPTLPGYRAKSDPRRKCSQCGCAMRPVVKSTSTTEVREHTRADGTKFTRHHTVVIITAIVGYGYDGHGDFCSLKCGYRYARRQLEMIRAEQRQPGIADRF